MPNNVTNRLIITGSPTDVYNVLNFLGMNKNGSIIVNFENITPIPPWVYGYNSDTINISNIEKYGEENTIIGWCWDNWGTKWNAYGQIDDRSRTPILYNVNCTVISATVYFTTAWSGVEQLMQKVCWIFPNVNIQYSFCDENSGYNLASYEFKDTDIISEYIPEEGSKEAFELYLDITQKTPEESYIKYNPNTDNYEYIDN